MVDRNGANEAYIDRFEKFSNISVASQSISTVNSFTIPPTMVLKDVTYDLTLKLPVSLLINASSECFIMVGYGPVNASQQLTLTQLESCNNVSTIGAMLDSNILSTVATLTTNGISSSEVCRGQPGLKMSCDRNYNVLYSNLIGSTKQLGVFPAVYTRVSTNENFVGVLNQLDVATALGRLTAGNVGDNQHIPIYWDPVHSVVAGAWKTTSKQIQVFAATYPYQGWYSPASFALPQGELIGFALAYKPVPPPTRPPTTPTPPVKAPSSSKTGIIVGAVIGGLAAFGFFIGVALFVRNSFSFQYRKIPSHE